MIIIIFIFETTKNKPTTLSDSVAKCPKAVKSEQVKYHCVRENAIIRCSARQINVIFELHVMIQICEQIVVFTKKPTAKDEEKAKKEAAKKAKEAEKAEAEKRRNAEIAARIAQATKRISSQHKQKDVNHQPSSVEPLQEDNVHPLSVPAFRKQKTSVFNPASTSSQEQPVNRKQTTIQSQVTNLNNRREASCRHC